MRAVSSSARKAIGYAHAIKVEALSRLGELLENMPKNLGGRPEKTGSAVEPVVDDVPTYADLNIDKKTAMVAQQLAEELDAKRTELTKNAEIERFKADVRGGCVNGERQIRVHRRRHLSPRQDMVARLHAPLAALMKAEVYCPKHHQRVKIVPPSWAPWVLEWAEVRELLTGCVCEDPDPRVFDPVWLEILGHLHADDDEVESGAISLTLRVVRGVPLSAWLDPDVRARMLRGTPLRELLDPDDPRRPKREGA